MESNRDRRRKRWSLVDDSQTKDEGAS